MVTKKLVVEAGATFTGSCNMGGIIKDMKYDEESSFQKSSADQRSELLSRNKQEEKTA